MTRTTIRLRQIDCCEPVLEPVAMTASEQDRLIAMFRALGDRTRLEIFRLIAAQNEPICACEIVERFEVTQPTVAHHTRVLREAGLITSSKRGIWAYYGVDRAGLDSLGSAVNTFVPEMAFA